MPAFTRFKPKSQQPVIAGGGQRNAACYHGGAFFKAIGEDFADLSRRHQIINADVLDAWFPPAPSVVSALEHDLPWLLRTSPPTHCDGLIDTVARVRGVPAASVLAGSGSSDLIFRAFREWLTPESRVLVLDPSYGEYTHVCERVIGCHVSRIALERQSGYRVDLDELRDRLREAFDLVVIVNPNNPTGQHIPRADLEAVLAAAPEHTRYWVDEAYLEYVQGAESMERFAATSPNVVVCKSLSKVYALSGARAAYLVADPRTVDELRPLTPPWVVSLPAQLAAVRALEAPAYYADCYRRTTLLRAALEGELLALEPRVQVFGVGNFVLCHFPACQPEADELERRCRAHGVFIRDISRAVPRLGRHVVRFAVKDDETQARMIRVVRHAVVKPLPDLLAG